MGETFVPEKQDQRWNGCVQKTVASNTGAQGASKQTLYRTDRVLSLLIQSAALKRFGHGQQNKLIRKSCTLPRALATLFAIQLQRLFKTEVFNYLVINWKSLHLCGRLSFTRSVANSWVGILAVVSVVSVVSAGLSSTKIHWFVDRVRGPLT